MDLVSFTKGYFNKTEDLQQLTVTTICAEVIVKMLERDIQLKDVLNEINTIIKAAVEQEDYETAQVLKLVKKELTDGL